MHIEMSHSFNIVVIGRLNQQKNLSLIIKAFALNIKNYAGTIRLHFIGEGEELAMLKSLAKSLNVEEHLSFHGYKEDVLPYMKEADLMIIASRYEGLPNVVLEAFSQKLLVLASDISSIKELIKDKQTGILFKDNDIKDLSDKILFCIKNDLSECVDKAYKSLSKYQNINKEFEKLLIQIGSDYGNKN